MDTITIDKDLALVYMGTRGRDASVLMPLVDECEKRLLEAVSPNYILKVFGIERTEAGIALSGTGLLLTGESIASHLEGCDECALLCATLSLGADRLISSLAAEDMAASYVTDCLASAAIESVCDEAEKELAEKLPGKFLTWRYSPGYGDLPLSLQPEIINVMNAGKRIGLSVTDSLMLIPSKSVTAVIGISRTSLPKAVKGCIGCIMYENCSFRKGGYHCGS